MIQKYYKQWHWVKQLGSWAFASCYLPLSILRGEQITESNQEDEICCYTYFPLQLSHFSKHWLYNWEHQPHVVQRRKHFPIIGSYLMQIPGLCHVMQLLLKQAHETKSQALDVHYIAVVKMPGFWQNFKKTHPPISVTFSEEGPPGLNSLVSYRFAVHKAFCSCKVILRIPSQKSLNCCNVYIFSSTVASYY